MVDVPALNVRFVIVEILIGVVPDSDTAEALRFIVRVLELLEEINPTLKL